jgi:hypothetical protein
MPNFKKLSDDDLSLTIDRTQAAIEGQKLIVAKLIAGAAGFWTRRSISSSSIRIV